MNAARTCLLALVSSSSLSFLPSVSLAAQSARSTRADPALLAPRHLYELGDPALPFDVRCTGDLDGDGDVDLVALDPSDPPRFAQIWMNRGRNDFFLANELVFAPWNYDLANTVALGDFDGNGVLDLAYERTNTIFPGGNQGLVVHLGNGDGTFAPHILASSLGFMSSFVVGDCDGDGDDDVLVSQSLNGVGRCVWLRLEAGSFQFGTPLDLPTGAGLALCADLDGDGNADAVARRGNDVVLLRTVDRSPTLDAIVPVPPPIPAIWATLVGGDLEGDGDFDLLMVELGSAPLPTQDVMRPILNDGGVFAFQPLQLFDRSFGTSSLENGALVDWDDDGDLDYVSTALAWMENIDGATFERAAMQPGPFQAGTPRIADLNGDGHQDLLLGRTLFAGDGTFPARSSGGSFTGGAFAAHAWSEVVDWEGDGDLDLVDPAYLYLNDGAGGFAGRATPLPPAPVSGAPTEVGWADFDGDGLRDRIVRFDVYPPSFQGVFLFRGTADGSYVLAPTSPSPAAMTGGACGDIDGDGDIDVLGRSGCWLNDGAGFFGAESVPAYAGEPRLAADFDGDGDLDLLVERNGLLFLLRQESGLTFASQSVGVESELSSFLDVDQDGDLDLVLVRPSAGRITIREQRADGSLADPLLLGVPDMAGPAGQLDLDGDGRLDLAAGIGSVGSRRRIAVWPRGEGMTFSTRREYWTADLPLAYLDLDRDGDIDAAGQSILRNFRFDGPAAGSALQYGLATPGTQGRSPVLGARSPVRPGAELRLVIGGGRGGASGYLLRGAARADFVAGGFRNLVAGASVVRNFVLGGTPGQAGAGTLVLRTPITSALAGLTFDYQAVLVDPGAAQGVSATNGLEIRYGDGFAVR